MVKASRVLAVVGVLIAGSVPFVGLPEVAAAVGSSSGVVTGPDGLPIECASVSAYQYTTYSRAVTDSLGRFRLTVGWGEWVIGVSPADPSTAQSYSSSMIDVVAGATVLHDVRLVAGGQLAIHADDASGFSVMAICRDPAVPVIGGSIGIQCSDPQATAGFRYGGERDSALLQHAFGLAPGRYRVAALRADGSTLSTATEFAMVAGQSADCTLRFGLPSTCAGGPVDTTSPTVMCPVPAVFILNQPLSSVRATAVDGAATWSVSVSADTTRVGTQQVVVTATDPEGNRGEAACEYRVTYKFSGFSSPVSDSRVNLVRSRDHVTLGWKLTDYQGHRVGDSSSFVSFQTKVHTCRSQAKVKTLRASHDAEGFALRSVGKFRYVWEPRRALRGKCVTATLTLSDGTSHAVEFKVR